MEGSTIINRALPDVFNYLKMLKHIDQYNKWAMHDPHMRKTLTGTDGTVGFIFSWDSNDKNAGKGAQEIIAIKENERIDYELRFEKPFKNIAYSSLIVQPSLSNQTMVTWTFNGRMRYPFNLLHVLLGLGKMLNKDIATSLQNLKSILEKK